MEWFPAAFYAYLIGFLLFAFFPFFTVAQVDEEEKLKTFVVSLFAPPLIMLVVYLALNLVYQLATGNVLPFFNTTLIVKALWLFVYAVIEGGIYLFLIKHGTYWPPKKR